MKLTKNNLLSAFPGDRWTDRLDEDQAKAIVSILNTDQAKNNPNNALDRVNAIMNAHGVENLNSEETGESCYYINTGDTYSATILFDCNKWRFSVTTMGDWYESTRCYKLGELGDMR